MLPLSQALQTLCSDADMVATLATPQHWMRDFFLASLCLDLSHNAEALSRLQTLSQVMAPPSCLPASAGLHMGCVGLHASVLGPFNMLQGITKQSSPCDVLRSHLLFE